MHLEIISTSQGEGGGGRDVISTICYSGSLECLYTLSGKDRRVKLHRYPADNISLKHLIQLFSESAVPCKLWHFSILSNNLKNGTLTLHCIASLV